MRIMFSWPPLAAITSGKFVWPISTKVQIQVSKTALSIDVKIDLLQLDNTELLGHMNHKTSLVHLFPRHQKAKKSNVPGLIEAVAAVQPIRGGKAPTTDPTHVFVMLIRFIGV